MSNWAFMIDPTTNSIGLYDEPTPALSEADYENPDAPCNAPLNNPASHLAYIYWHILLDNMEVAFDTTVTINHLAVAAGSAPTGEAAASAALQYDNTFTDWDVHTHNLGYECFVIAAVDNKMLVPGYPVQVPPVVTGSARFVAPYVTPTKVFLHEYRSQGTAGLSAQSITYRLMGFKKQPAVDGTNRLVDFDRTTGVLRLGQGRFSSDRRYLQVAPGGSTIGMPYGRTLDLKNGAMRVAKSDGTTVDPYPPGTFKQGVWAIGGSFATDTLTYGPPADYNGAWVPSEIIQVQAP